ncbi:type II toxin-antitoxin system VapC family toxin [Egibacter rhizosphaerae]|uniref:type II toxin-antitoxin system VapC family toxin n=1 Tax=Egibacter rhizosphaerae TaxID=1670831 RepID=UPI00197A8B84|nr:type II toxin-antitoxin system VapC family toxin [Egibacter rhizosphaerae]
MTRGLAHTSLFVAREHGRSLEVERLPEELAVSVITIGELRAGVLAAHDVATRDRRLATLAQASRLDPLTVDRAVADVWARLRVELRDAGQRMPVNDAWIAATALAWEVPVVTRDDDFDVTVTGLDTIRV